MYTDMHMLTTARHGGDSLCTGHEKHMVPMTLTPVYTYKLKSAGTMHAAFIFYAAYMDASLPYMHL